jgi:hypothetical protein
MSYSFHNQVDVISPEPCDDSKGAMDIVLCHGYYSYLSKIVLIIELKLESKLTSVSQYEIAAGQLLQYTTAVMELQPARRQIFAVLCSEKRAYLFDTKRVDTNNYETTISQRCDVFRFIHFLLTNTHLLGPEAPPEQLLYDQFLGEGKTARTYSFRDIQGDLFVHKKATSSYRYYTAFLSQQVKF